MKLTRNEILGIIYEDLFDFPLTEEEVVRWQLNSTKVTKTDHQTGKPVIQKQGYYFVRGKEETIGRREERERTSRKKVSEAAKVANILVLIPTVEAVFLTGSVAAGNAVRESDIDLMVITRPGWMWVSRGIILVILRYFLKNYRRPGKEQDKICTNIFLDADHLTIKKRNVYTAHEVLMARQLAGKREVGKVWLQSNQWTNSWLPEAYLQASRKFKIESDGDVKQTQPEKQANWVEELAYRAQLKIMRNKITNEAIGKGEAFFHPRDLSVEINKQFKKRLSSLGMV